MLFWMIVAAVASSVCQYLITGETKAGGLNQENSQSVIFLAGISVLIGLLLYYLGSFGIEMYEDNTLDFYDYGKITAEGVEYFALRLLGAVTVALTFIEVLVCIAVGLKNKEENETKNSCD